MNCRRPHCTGFIRDPGDGIGPRCSLCGRSPLPPPTREELLAAGVYHTEKSKEAEGYRKRGVEYTPAPFHPPGRYARRERQSG